MVLMKRASYRDAIYWIAQNDSAADDGADDPQTVGELVTSSLIADVFGVSALKVGTDVVRQREKLRRLER